MRVLLNDNHVPHAWMVATSLPDVEFVAPLWNPVFRPVPPNVQVVLAPDYLDLEYDAVIEDDPALPAFLARAPVRVWLQHCEYNQGPELPRAMERATRVVATTPHRRATMREWGLDPRVTVVGFYCDVDVWPQAEYGPGKPVGTSHNALCWNAEVRGVIEAVAEHQPLTVLGHHNGKVRGCRTLEPVGLPAYQEALAGFSVWVYCVAGDQMGMSPLEAMACGLPVVTATYPETGLFAFDGWNCRLRRAAPVDSTQWLAETATELLEQPEERERLGTGARATVRALFPLEECGALWREVLCG